MPHQDLRTKAGVILAQSDTTIGFFSHDQDRLNATKNSPKNKRLLQVCAGFKDLPRVPLKHRSLVRHKKATFVYKGKEGWRAFRVVQDPLTLVFLERLGVVFSTSANLSGQGYEPQIALDLANTIIEDKRGLSPRKPSSIIKLGHARKRRLR
ncbi:N6-threonylcarbamoyl adenosine t(6)A37 modification in tRNA [Helicobacter sp. NHP22-001]|uniref:N6-threonylcarbamoyl adenosine t(6)A37 modification in tRNA n=1 Tax=Helicobacter sp. NHP22-001 TaxID=3040202 RepID=UPI00244D8261|nr:N6-threonylcarbamoyl adenosine t(6)A37 modification in tRNA [Helicobacter sp. NHP22-001]GMB95641.1 Sua5 YciO YrdC YwlC family protein [Helicobacter sp. NHP22-001]